MRFLKPGWCDLQGAKTLFCEVSQPAIDLSNDFSIEIA